LVPQLLEETGIDCWLLIAREYVEDPVLASMLPATWLNARRLMMLVLTPTRRYAVTRYPVGDVFAQAWDPTTEPDQWGALAHLLSDLDPAAIAIGTNPLQAHSDGLTASLRDSLVGTLPEHLAARIVSGGHLGVRWLETRLPQEREVLADATERAHGILRRGLSEQAITPGLTTTEDLEWWYRQTVHEAGYATWFHPSVTIQRMPDRTPPDGRSVIDPGDLVHVDFGIIHKGLCTDQQEHAYVLKPGENSAPVGLTDGLSQANRIQDILVGEFRPGRSGNDILAGALAKARHEGLNPTIYTHSIGVHGHGAGMTIGLWDRQEGVPGPGDHPLHPNTAYSIELSGETAVAEWDGQRVRFMLEQDAWFDGHAVTWLDGRQDQLWLI
jgi:Xaa-Pro aminopeptidase